MNKKLHLLVAVLGLFGMSNVNAQTTISFEASEGFTLGDINGQNGWSVTGDGAGGFISNQEISSTLASDGTQSLKIDEDTAFGPQGSIVMGAFYYFSVPLNSTHYSIAADINFEYTAGIDESAFMMGIAGEISFISQFIFDYTGDLAVTTIADDDLAFATISNKTWAGNQWYNVKIEVDGSTVKYYLNNNLEYTGTVWSNEQFEHMRFTHDNWGGAAYIDNVVITDYDNMGIEDVEKFAYTVSPNPFTDIINVSVEDKNVQSVYITDMNGRIVKEFNSLQGNEIHLNASELTAGMYLLNVKADGVTIAKKIIKK